MTPRTVAHQAPLSMGFSRQAHWSVLLCPLPGDLPDPGIQCASPALQTDSLPCEPQGRPKDLGKGNLFRGQGTLRSRSEEKGRVKE